MVVVDGDGKFAFAYLEHYYYYYHLDDYLEEYMACLFWSHYFAPSSSSSYFYFFLLLLLQIGFFFVVDVQYDVEISNSKMAVAEALAQNISSFFAWRQPQGH